MFKSVKKKHLSETTVIMIVVLNEIKLLVSFLIECLHYLIK